MSYFNENILNSFHKIIRYHNMSQVFVKKDVFKVVMGGDGAVGKTCLAYKLAGTFNNNGEIKMTPGLDIHTMGVDAGDINILQIWDLSGQEQFRFFQDFFFKNAKIFFLIFNVEWLHSFFNLISWLSMIPKKHIIRKFLIANKIDCENRAVTEDNARELA